DLVIGRDDRTDLCDLIVVQVADPLIDVDPGLLQDVLRACPADSVDIREADFRPLVLWQIYAGNSCHAGVPFVLSLPLFVLRILADDTDDAFPPYDLAVFTKPFYRGSYFHSCLIYSDK